MAGYGSAGCSADRFKAKYDVSGVVCTSPTRDGSKLFAGGARPRICVYSFADVPNNSHPFPKLFTPVCSNRATSDALSGFSRSTEYLQTPELCGPGASELPLLRAFACSVVQCSEPLSRPDSPPPG